MTRSEQEVLATRRENDNLQTVIETLKQQNKNLQIEKDTEVEALSSQVCSIINVSSNERRKVSGKGRGSG